MAWEWLAPTSALVGVVAGLAFSIVTEKRKHRLAIEQLRIQHELTAEAELRRRGREYAQHAVDALLVLRTELPKTVYPAQFDVDAHDLCTRTLERLERLVMYLADPVLRNSIDLSHSVLEWPEEVSQWGGEEVGMPRRIIWEVCKEALDVLAKYLRDEPIPSELTPLMRLYERAQASTLQEKRAQWEEQDRWVAEERKRAREEARKSAPSEEETGPGPGSTE